MCTSENRTTEISRSQGPGVCIFYHIHIENPAQILQAQHYVYDIIKYPLVIHRIYQILYPRARKSTTHLTLLHSVAELMRQMTRKMACFFRHLGNEVSRNENDNSHFRSHLLLLSSYSWMISTKIACFDRSLSQTSYGAVHKRRRQLGRGRGQKLVKLSADSIKKLSTWGRGRQKSGKIADVVYGWSLWLKQLRDRP